MHNMFEYGRIMPQHVVHTFIGTLSLTMVIVLQKDKDPKTVNTSRAREYSAGVR